MNSIWSQKRNGRLFYRKEKREFTLLRAKLRICGDFNICHREWLTHLPKYCHYFSINYELTQVVDNPTHVSNIAGYHAKLLDFSSPHLINFPLMLSLLSTSNHSLICQKWWQTKGIFWCLISKDSLFIHQR